MGCLTKLIYKHHVSHFLNSRRAVYERFACTDDPWEYSEIPSSESSIWKDKLMNSFKRTQWWCFGLGLNV